MIHLKANGKDFKLAAQTPLPEFIKTLELSMEQVVIEKNGEALTQKEASEMTLQDGDKLEIVRIVAGG